MPIETRSQRGVNKLEIVYGITAERLQRERGLDRAGVLLPLPQQAFWAPFAPHSESCLIAFKGPADTEGAIGLQLTPSGALPGHRIARIERFGGGLKPALRETALNALVEFGKRDRRILRIHVEALLLDSEERKNFMELASRSGFVRSRQSRCYEHTLLIDLRPPEDAVFAGLHATARRHIRAAAKHSVAIRSITDPSLFGRMDQLYRETFARSGGIAERQNWAAILQLCREAPHASRLLGLYRTDQDVPEALLAFAWGCLHGDHAHFATAASSRVKELKIPLMYPIVWDLLRWAKLEGAQLFDFGGVTPGTHESEDPVGGISDFKRYFSRDVVEVGGEWVYEPRPLRSRTATILSNTFRSLTRNLGSAVPASTP